MRALEIIHLRMSSAGTYSLVELVRNSVVTQSDVSDVRVYRHASLHTDLIVHLHRSIAEQSDSVSDSGERLASLLRAHGMVEHSVWMEQD